MLCSRLLRAKKDDASICSPLRSCGWIFRCKHLIVNKRILVSWKNFLEISMRIECLLISGFPGSSPGAPTELFRHLAAMVSGGSSAVRTTVYNLVLALSLSTPPRQAEYHDRDSARRERPRGNRRRPTMAAARDRLPVTAPEGQHERQNLMGWSTQARLR
jgi:hypothetical protein